MCWIGVWRSSFFVDMSLTSLSRIAAPAAAIL
jgi:hypothetical protein